VHEFVILQAARMKGRLSAEAAAASAGIETADATAELDRLRDAGLVKGEGSVRLTPEGRERLANLVSEERAGVDAAALTSLYEEFDSHNTGLKEIVSSWQMRGGGPNDHSDQDYDQSVLDRLVRLDQEFQPLVARIGEVAPRLQQYAVRFTHAIDQVRGGDTTFVARPITDSYHTVWFEFHEELIGLLGLSREEEAAAGRAV
jgi:DNA-binding MarR family transcriptional regulator